MIWRLPEQITNDKLGLISSRPPPRRRGAAFRVPLPKDDLLHARRHLSKSRC
jgi:hypothetical protein